MQETGAQQVVEIEAVRKNRRCQQVASRRTTNSDRQLVLRQLETVRITSSKHQAPRQDSSKLLIVAGARSFRVTTIVDFFCVAVFVKVENYLSCQEPPPTGPPSNSLKWETDTFPTMN